jgi:hypothetical protein
LGAFLPANPTGEQLVYEREWRLYLKAEQASKTLTVGEETIHLIDFPVEAVQRVILGLCASDELKTSLKSILASGYPHARLSRVFADRRTASLIEAPVA